MTDRFSQRQDGDEHQYKERKWNSEMRMAEAITHFDYGHGTIMTEFSRSQSPDGPGYGKYKLLEILFFFISLGFNLSALVTSLNDPVSEKLNELESCTFKLKRD